MELDKMLIYAGVGVAGFLAKWLFDKLIKSDDHYHSLQLQIVKLEGKIEAVITQLTAISRVKEDVDHLHGKVREINKELQIRFKEV